MQPNKIQNIFLTNKKKTYAVNFTITTPTPQRQNAANRFGANIVTNSNHNDDKSRSRFLEGLNLETPFSLQTSNFNDSNANFSGNNSNFNSNNHNSNFSKIRFSTPTFESRPKKQKLEFKFNDPSFPSPMQISPAIIDTSNNNINNNNIKQKPTRLTSNFAAQEASESSNHSEQNKKPKEKQNRSQSSSLSGLTLVTNQNDSETGKGQNRNENELRRTSFTDIDFSSNIWHEVNTMLSRCGFNVLMKQHNQKFEPIPPQIIICNV